ncbi:MAG: ATPase [candidate division Zixibacteria bacterium]|nr:ATPase [candidate division Zixibacteria bacterium]
MSDNKVFPMNAARRCSKCILPESTPGISFDDNGVCSYCRSYRSPILKGEQALLSVIEKYKNKNNQFDCIVNISGGRDSAYTILKMAKDYELKVLAVNYENPFTHPLAKRNIKNIKDILGVELISFAFKPGFHEKLLKLNLQALLKKPDPAMVPMVCISCKLIWKNILDIAKDNEIKLIVSGGNLYEQTAFKRNLLGGDQNQGLRSYYSTYIFGLARHTLQNLRFLRPKTLIPTIKGYMFSNPYSPLVQLLGRGIAKIDLFHYLSWDEDQVVGRIQNELDWKYPDEGFGSWRFDCEIGHLKDLFYTRILGLTEKDDFYSKLIREGMISRERALERISLENRIHLETIKNLMKTIRMDYSELEKLGYSANPN